MTETEKKEFREAIKKAEKRGEKRADRRYIDRCDRCTKAAHMQDTSNEYDDLIAEAKKHVESAKERKEFSMSNNTETLAQDNVMDHIDRYLNAHKDDNRRLEAIQNLIKALRRDAVKLHAASIR